jgi:hypothetical protein
LLPAKGIPTRKRIQFLQVAYVLLKKTSKREDAMKDATRLPERTDADGDEFPCRSCGETFNSLAEAEQHEKDCRNRKTSGG